MKTERPRVADDHHQSQVAASLRLSEAKLASQMGMKTFLPKPYTAE